jgi:hypothetical protein
MGVIQRYLEEIIELAKEVELSDPVDWSDLSIDEDSAYRLVASGVLDDLGIQNVRGRIHFETNKDVIIASIVKLVVENFVLNLKLAQKEKNGN